LAAGTADVSRCDLQFSRKLTDFRKIADIQTLLSENIPPKKLLRCEGLK
jgi:hypothetical protein